MDYIAYLHKDQDSDFGVSFPDFPGCVTAGRTLEEARQMAAEALELHIDGMIEDRYGIPVPSTLDELAKDPALKSALLAFLVHIEPKPVKTVRVNITMSERELQIIDSLAKEADRSRSAYLVQAALLRNSVAELLKTVPAGGSHPKEVQTALLKKVVELFRTVPADSHLEQVLRNRIVELLSPVPAGPLLEEVHSEEVEVVAARRIPPKRPHAAKR